MAKLGTLRFARLSEADEAAFIMPRTFTEYAVPFTQFPLRDVISNLDFTTQ
jgi:hypothetical protein